MPVFRRGILHHLILAVHLDQRKIMLPPNQVEELSDLLLNESPALMKSSMTQATHIDMIIPHAGFHVTFEKQIINT